MPQPRQLASLLAAAIPAGGMPASPAPLPAQQETELQSDVNHGLNPRFTLARFIEGECNRFARRVAEELVSGRAPYQSVCFFGRGDVGKTHLIHAVARALLAAEPGLNLLLVTAEQFVNEFTNSVRFDRMPEFRERYRGLDALLIDGIHFIVGKVRSEEELLHTLQFLHVRGKRIVTASDTSPFRLSFGQEELCGYLGEMAVDIQPLDLSTRAAFVRMRMREEGVVEGWPEAVVDYLAKNVGGGARRLEAAVRRLAAESRFENARVLRGQMSTEWARQRLDALGLLREERVSWQLIIEAVAHAYGVKAAELKKKSNRPHEAVPRQVAMYLIKKLTELSFTEIGRLFTTGKAKHHSTVMYSVDKVQRERSRDPLLAAKLEDLERILANA